MMIILTVAIPDVEILYMEILRLETLRGWSQCMGLKVVKSRS